MKGKSFVSYEMIANALFENYESVYDINMETSAYKTYFQSDSYKKLKLAKEGNNFFKELLAGVNRTIAVEDRGFVLHMLQRDVLLTGVRKEKYYTIVYRIQKDGRLIYHQLRATLQPAEDGIHILMGIRDIDDLVREQIAQRDKIEAMREKEKNHLEAILGSASAYMEANLSENRLLENVMGQKDGKYLYEKSIPSLKEISEYDAIQNWIADNLIIEGAEKYREVSSRKHLLSCFLKGDRRASLSFSARTIEGDDQPGKVVFYLYQEKPTQNIHVFCVFYDLTEEQKKEQELENLEQELLLSRIRNSTSQMQPHFLYNALGSIQEVILMDPQYASDLLGDFTVHLRSCVRAMTTDATISFDDELKNIKAYVNIEKMRLGKKLDVEYNIQTMDFNILPLCIQPLVENAIRHGIYKKGKTGGKVIIGTSEDHSSVYVRVKDNGVGFDASQLFQDMKPGKRDSTGLKNICFRLEKVMGASVDIFSEIGAGTIVTISLPKEGNHASNYSG